MDITQERMEAYLAHEGWRGEVIESELQRKFRCWTKEVTSPGGVTTWRVHWRDRDDLGLYDRWGVEIAMVIDKLAVLYRKEYSEMREEIVAGAAVAIALAASPPVEGEHALEMTEPLATIYLPDTGDKLTVQLAEGKIFIRYYPAGQATSAWTKFDYLSPRCNRVL